MNSSNATSNTNPSVSDLSVKTQHLKNKLKTGVEVSSLWTTPRRRCYLDIQNKAKVIAYLDTHYQGWREQACNQAARFLTMTLQEAKGNRAMSGITALGIAWWATDDPKYGKAYEQHYLQTATGELFNWGAFAGAQATAELPAHLMLTDCPGYSQEGRLAVLDHLLELNRIAWEERTSKWGVLSLGPEGHNWYIHGIDCLPYVGTLFPELTQADFYRQISWNLIEEHLRGNYHRDGGSRERTPGYHGGSVRIMWTIYAMMKRNAHLTHWQPSPVFESQLLRATHFLVNLMTPKGDLPAFGDSYTLPGALASIFALAAAVSGDGLCKWAAEQSQTSVRNDNHLAQGQLPLGAFWALGEEGASAYAKVVAKPPTGKSIFLPYSGFGVMRESWDNDAACMLINAAPRGSIVTSHEHNDLFSFDLYANDTRFLGQAGIAPYNTTPGRDYDVSTRAHNTLTLQGEEQLPIVNQWRWDGRVIPAIRRWDISEHLEIFQGVHEGFCKPERQVLHERKIVFVKQNPQEDQNNTLPSYWVIFDRVITEDQLPCEIWFHGCVPGTIQSGSANPGSANQGASNLLFDAGDGKMLGICPPVGDELGLRQDESDEVKAYAQEAKFDLQKHPAFCYDAKVGSHVFVWVLMPVTSAKDLPRVERIKGYINGSLREHDPMTAVRIRHRHGVDELYASHLMHDALMGPDEDSATFSQTILQRHTGNQTGSQTGGQTDSQTTRINRSTLDGCQDALS